jgi:hypothetical protein
MFIINWGIRYLLRSTARTNGFHNKLLQGAPFFLKEESCTNTKKEPAATTRQVQTIQLKFMKNSIEYREN